MGYLATRGRPGECRQSPDEVGESDKMASQLELVFAELLTILRPRGVEEDAILPAYLLLQDNRMLEVLAKQRHGVGKLFVGKRKGLVRARILDIDSQNVVQLQVFACYRRANTKGGFHLQDWPIRRDQVAHEA